MLGSISTAVLACRLFGLADPRLTGSHNPGATNVLRMGNKFAAALTLVGDMAKGVIPVMVAQHLGFSDDMAALCGLCAFLGHLYPVYFDFFGGKGVATALGVLGALHWPAMIIVAWIWLLIAWGYRVSALASIASFMSAPIVMLFLEPRLFNAVLILSMMLLFRHRHNVVAIIKGQQQNL